MTRLSRKQEAEAIRAYSDHTGRPEEGCQVIYQDDLDTGETCYQVVDAEGHGDGSGLWTPVTATTEVRYVESGNWRESMSDLQPATTQHPQMRLVAYRQSHLGTLKGVYEIPADYPLPWGMAELPGFAERLSSPRLLGSYVIIR